MRRRLQKINLSPVWRCSLFFFMFWAAMSIFGPFKNVYLSHLGLSGLEIAILNVLAPIMTLFAAPALSVLADRRRWRKRILIYGLGGVALLLGLYGLPKTFLALLPIASILAMISSSILPISNSLIARMAQRHSLDFGKLRFWGSLSFALGSITFGALWERYGFDAMFIACAVAFIPVMGLAFTLEESAAQRSEERHSLRRVLQDRGLTALLAATFLYGVGETLYANFSGIYMDSLGGGQQLVGAIFGLSALAELPAMRYGGDAARKFGRPTVILVGYMAMIIAYFGYALSATPGLLLFYGVLKGFGFGLSYAVAIALVDARAPESWSSTLQSLMTAMSWGLAPLITLPLGGWLSDLLGLPVVFLGAGIAQVAATAILLFAILGDKFAEKPLLGMHIGYEKAVSLKH